jgi:uncharacterized protein (DUF302 family)
MTHALVGAHEATTPEGIVSRLSNHSVGETIAQLVSALNAGGVKLFATIDHSGEAERVGLTLRETKLLVFGSPKAGTPLMEENPLIALDLPLKILVWQDDEHRVWMTFLDGVWLAARYTLSGDITKVLSAVDALAGRVAESLGDDHS